MDKEIKSTLKIIVFYTLALVVTSATHSAIIPDTFPFYGISTIYLLILAVFLLRFFYEKTMGGESLRILLITIALLIIFWIVLRGAKYHFFWDSDTVRRHLWYMYYIPQILIPVLTFYVSITIDYIDGRGRKRGWYIPVLFAVVLIISVLTNDLHQKIFIFNPGYTNWDRDYSYGFLFFPIIVFIYGFLLAAFIVMVCKCHKYYPNKPFWIVTLPFIIGTILLVLSSLDTFTINGIVYRGAIINTSEIHCYMSATFLSACIKMGLIPSNENHSKVLKRSSLDLSIRDNRDEVKYDTNAGNNRMSNTDILVKKYEFRNGYAIWKEDVSEINVINSELSQSYEKLSEESELIKLENDLKEQNAIIKFRTRLYEIISERTSNTTEMIYKLARAQDNRKSNAKLICFLGAYLKRYANLTIINVNRGNIPVNELFLSVKESLKYLNFMDIPCEITMDTSEEIALDGEIIICAYELFENVVVNSLGKLIGVYGNIQIQQSADANKQVFLKLYFEGADLNEVNLFSKEIKDNAIKIYEEDGITYLNLKLTEGRECYGL